MFPYSLLKPVSCLGRRVYDYLQIFGDDGFKVLGLEIRMYGFAFQGSGLAGCVGAFIVPV